MKRMFKYLLRLRLLQRSIFFCFCLSPWLMVYAVFAQERITVYAAASATNAITEIAAVFEERTGIKIRASFASSSSLARQIESGAPAQIYLSANTKWMDHLQARGLLVPGSRRDLLGNSLVLIAPEGRGFKVEMKKRFDFAGAFKGKLSMGDPSHVPAGIYAREALLALGWWMPVSKRVIGALDVRFALSFVERGEAGAGIVYMTDSKMTDKVKVVGIFPEWSHTAISYPVALVNGAGESAREFIKFLSSEDAREVFERYGFKVNSPSVRGNR